LTTVTVVAATLNGLIWLALGAAHPSKDMLLAAVVAISTPFILAALICKSTRFLKFTILGVFVIVVCGEAIIGVALAGSTF